MIHDLRVSKDKADFPVVSWMESRNAFSPEGVGSAHVECRIMKDGKTGELLFVARGTVRDPYGKFEEGKPWEKLRGFSKHAAEGLYPTRVESEFWKHVLPKSPVAKGALSDGAMVVQAEFRDDAAIHINCANAPQNDINRLLATLLREFAVNQPLLIEKLSHNSFYWPVGDDRLITYDPGRTGWSEQAKPSLIRETLKDAAMLGVIGGSLALISWMAGLWLI